MKIGFNVSAKWSTAAEEWSKLSARCFFVGLLLAGTASTLRSAEMAPLYKLSSVELEQRIAEDSKAVVTYRSGLRSVMSYVDANTNLFPQSVLNAPGLLRRGDKEAVWGAWQRLLDYSLALDSIEQYHAGFYRLKQEHKEDSFLIGYAAMLARYRTALEFIRRTENNPELDKVLNDAVPEIGLPAGSYAKLKFKTLNVGAGMQFAAYEALMKTFTGGRQPALREAIAADARDVWNTGKGAGEVLTAKNAIKVIQNGAQTAWLPLQQGVSEWMGHTKVYRHSQSLITEAQVEQLRLEPGDVLLERREWYLSNIGLPGFWSHAALYIGTAQERGAYFDDAETQAWVRRQGEASGKLESLLRSHYADACRLMAASHEASGERHPVRIIEAIGEGVSFKTLEHSASCDSLVVLRPRLSKAEKAQAITRAFHYAGRPYDFNFDFSTDAELVCTELVYKSYEPSAGCTGLKFPMVEMLGRKVTPANELVKQLDAQYGTPEQQFDVVIFLDGHERAGKAVESSVAELRQSWKRPKWHVITGN